ncbi:Tubulin/FtsZ family, GTPase domain protein [Cooperia oncophora]
MTCEESIHDNKDVFFYQADDDHYVPRAVLVDLEPRVINGIMTSENFSRLFNPDNIYMSAHGGGAGNNWASGYGQGGEVYEQIMDIIERESENSDQMDGFLFTHSVSGGTGSGMGSLILEKIRDRFPKKVIQTYSVFANHEDTSDVIVHPYNSVLSMERLIDFPGQEFDYVINHVVVIDNAALNRLAAGKFETQQPTFDHINSLVTRIMSTSTAMFRFDSHVLRSICSVTLSPVQPLHFIQSGFSPVVDPNESFTRKTSVVDVVRNLLKPTSMMVSTASMTRPSHCMLSAFLFLQGQITSTDVNTVALSGHVSGLMLNNNTSIAGRVCETNFFNNLLAFAAKMRLSIGGFLSRYDGAAPG